jgi:hypothetical protein
MCFLDISSSDLNTWSGFGQSYLSSHILINFCSPVTCASGIYVLSDSHSIVNLDGGVHLVLVLSP